ncbi:MAG: preprotein translocase subunit SecG [Eubacteriales bacterium]|nr:preprotein translocase subunit SecG [Eubacteriales bacterium]
MSGLRLVLTILLMVSSVALIVSVLLQKGDTEQSTIFGSATNSYFGKNKEKTKEGKLAMATKVTASVFILLSIVMLFA